MFRYPGEDVILDTTSLAEAEDLMDRAEWLALGYVQGQRDLILHLLTDRFDDGATDALRSCVAQASPHLLDKMGPIILSALNIGDATAAVKALEGFTD